MKAEIETAIQEIRSTFGGAVEVEEDGDGGAFVKVSDLNIGSQYEPSVTWIGFRITFQYPFADVYPHFLPAGLKRTDGKALGEAIHTEGQSWAPPSGSVPATMVSRRSPRRDPMVDTAASKLQRILDWLRSR